MKILLFALLIAVIQFPPGCLPPSPPPLPPAPTTGELHGFVREAGTAKPVPNARIELAGPQQWVGFSAADGSYYTGQLLAGRYTYTVLAVGYAVVTGTVDLAAGARLRLDVDP